MIKKISGGVCAARGFTAAGMHTGLSRNPGKYDLGLIYCTVPCRAAAVYTDNKLKGAPIAVTKRHIANGTARAVICNSTNANTCTPDGEEKSELMCTLAAEALGIAPDDVICASTGVIGKTLNIAPIRENIGALAEKLSDKGSADCAYAIMTTDRIIKETAVSFTAGGTVCRIGGIAKGSGMIHPNMATVLCFITTDCNISAEMLQAALNDITRVTFNRVSVDGDTSTNDMAVVLSDGLAGNDMISSRDEDFRSFTQALHRVMRYLSREIAADGDTDAKLIECICTGADDELSAEKTAKAVICSDSIKIAFGSENADTGRIIAAAGSTGADIDITKTDIFIKAGGRRIYLFRQGKRRIISEEDRDRIFAEDGISMVIDLHSGTAQAEAWGCTLTENYIKVNGDYRHVHSKKDTKI